MPENDSVVPYILYAVILVIFFIVLKMPKKDKMKKDKMKKDEGKKSD